MFRFRGFSRRAIPAALALTSVVACSLALPLPVPAAKPSDTPFPCQHRACGCRDAESCWRDCCCFTHQQKLAWARSHGVDPPKAFLVAAKSAPKGDAPCCKPACCLAAKNDGHASDADHANAQPRPANGAVLMILALRCRGIHVSVTLLPPSLPVERPVFAHRLVERYASPPREVRLYEPPYLAVATPPPDVAAA